MTDDTWVDEPPPTVEPKPKRTVTPEQKAQRLKNKIKRGAHVTATQLAAQLNISPRIIRAHLRALKLPKPEHGWAWPPGEAKVIAAKISKRLRRPEPVHTVEESNVIELKVAS